jgi:hypothetical protein
MRRQERRRALSEAEKNSTAHQLTVPLFRLGIDKATLPPGHCAKTPSVSYDDVCGQEETMIAVYALIKRPIRHGRLFLIIRRPTRPLTNRAVHHTPEA